MLIVVLVQLYGAIAIASGDFFYNFLLTLLQLPADVSRVDIVTVSNRFVRFVNLLTSF